MHISRYQRQLELSRAQHNHVQQTIPGRGRSFRRFFSRPIPEEDLQSRDEDEESDSSEDESVRAPSVEDIPPVEAPEDSSEVPRQTRQRKLVSL